MRHLVHFQPRNRGDAVLREHGEVLDLIRKRDAEAAKQAMWNHVEAARLRLMKHNAVLVGGMPAAREQGIALEAAD